MHFGIETTTQTKSCLQISLSSYSPAIVMYLTHGSAWYPLFSMILRYRTWSINKKMLETAMTFLTLDQEDQMLLKKGNKNIFNIYREQWYIAFPKRKCQIRKTSKTNKFRFHTKTSPAPSLGYLANMLKMNTSLHPQSKNNLALIVCTGKHGESSVLHDNTKQLIYSNHEFSAAISPMDSPLGCNLKWTAFKPQLVDLSTSHSQLSGLTTREEEMAMLFCTCMCMCWNGFSTSGH